MEQQTFLQQLRKKCLSSLANEPIDATERELGYSAAMADIIKEIDNQNSKLKKEKTMVQQTAVEWFAIQLYEQGYFDGSTPKSITNLDHLQEQAKQMERKQIVDAFNGKPHCDGDGDRYYNETYTDY